MGRTTPQDGVFVVEWTRTEIDGTPGLDASWLKVGADWRWRGTALRLDTKRCAGPTDAERRRARAIAERLTGTPFPPEDTLQTDLPAPAQGFVVTDGTRLYPVGILKVRGRKLAVFEQGLPHQGAACWVTECSPRVDGRFPRQPDVICFTSDAMIATPGGACSIVHLRPGDKVLTRDNGPQPILWTGQTTLSGLALRKHPYLRPIRLRSDCMQSGLPQGDLCLSPAHRVLFCGPKARALYGSDEVLVRASDLVNYRNISPDLALHGVTYLHLLLDAHQIIFANGVATESFHPGLAPAETLRQHRQSLREVEDGWLAAPETYGPTVRRCLGAGEAALLAA